MNFDELDEARYFREFKHVELSMNKFRQFIILGDEQLFLNIL